MLPSASHTNASVIVPHLFYFLSLVGRPDTEGREPHVRYLLCPGRHRMCWTPRVPERKCALRQVSLTHASHKKQLLLFICLMLDFFGIKTENTKMFPLFYFGSLITSFFLHKYRESIHIIVIIYSIYIFLYIIFQCWIFKHNQIIAH